MNGKKVGREVGLLCRNVGFGELATQGDRLRLGATQMTADISDGRSDDPGCNVASELRQVQVRGFGGR